MKYKYGIYTPSLKREILVSEITTRQQKELVKSIMLSSNYEFIVGLRNVLDENLDYDSTGTLTLLDKMILLLRMRATSIGGNLSYSFVCDSCKKEIKADIQIVNILKKLLELDIPDLVEADETYSISYGIPNIETEILLEPLITKELNFNKTNLSETYSEVFMKDLLLFIKTVKLQLKDGITEVDLSFQPQEIRQKIIEKLPSKLLRKIWDQIQIIKKQINISLFDINCLCGHKIINSTLVIDNAQYTGFLKSVFSDNLHNIYQHIYYMTHWFHFTPEYIESLTPGERDVYWGYFNRDEKKRREAESNSDNVGSPPK